MGFPIPDSGDVVVERWDASRAAIGVLERGPATLSRMRERVWSKRKFSCRVLSRTDETGFSMAILDGVPFDDERG